MRVLLPQGFLCWSMSGHLQLQQQEQCWKKQELHWHPILAYSCFCNFLWGSLPIFQLFSFNSWVVYLRQSFSVGSFLLLLKIRNENVLQTPLATSKVHFQSCFVLAVPFSMKIIFSGNWIIHAIGLKGLGSGIKRTFSSSFSLKDILLSATLFQKVLSDSLTGRASIVNLLIFHGIRCFLHIFCTILLTVKLTFAQSQVLLP